MDLCKEVATVKSTNRQNSKGNDNWLENTRVTGRKMLKFLFS